MSISFIKTKHFIQRAFERNIPIEVEKLRLKAAKNKLKKKIKESCLLSGFDSTKFIYYTTIFEKRTIVYVCKQIDIGQFLILTAFFYEQ